MREQCHLSNTIPRIAASHSAAVSLLFDAPRRASTSGKTLRYPPAPQQYTTLSHTPRNNPGFTGLRAHRALAVVHPISNTPESFLRRVVVLNIYLALKFYPRGKISHHLFYNLRHKSTIDTSVTKRVIHIPHIINPRHIIRRKKTQLSVRQRYTH